MKAPLMALVLLFLSVGNVGAVQLPSAVVTDGLGVNIHFMPAWGGTALQNLDMIQAAGCKFVRMDCPWVGIEMTKGQYVFSDEDSLVSACAARGIRVIYNLDYSNSLYGSDYTSAAWQQGFTNFAWAAATHYKGDNIMWEVLNEPDGGVMSASTYMTLAKQAIPAMRQADPNCTILGPAVSNIDASIGQNYLTTCFQQGLLNLVDAVSVHPYRDATPGNPETVAADYTAVRNAMQTYGGKTLPILDSEWGWSVGSGGLRPVATAQLQGDYLARSFLINFSQGIPLSTWYDWENDGTDPTNPEENFGTVAADLSLKPAYNEMQLLAESLRGETFTKQLSDGHASDWLLVFTAPNGQQTLAAWTTRNGGRTVTVSGWGTLHLTSTPFYVDPSTVPEPGTITLLLMAGGLVSLVYGRRAWGRRVFWGNQAVS